MDEGADDIVALLCGHQDEVGKVCGDEEDGDPCERQRCTQLHDTPGRVQACTNDRYDQVRVLGDGYGGGVFGRQPRDGRRKHELHPGGMTHDRAFDGGDGHVQKDVLPIRRQAVFALIACRGGGPVRVWGLWQQNS